MALEEILTRKKRLRTAHRSLTTRLINQAEALLAEDSPDVDELTLLLRAATLSTLDAEIAEIILEEELEADIGRADEYMEKVQRIQIKIKAALNKKSTPLMVTTPHPTPSSPTSTAATSIAGIDPPPSTVPTVTTPDRTEGRTDGADHTLTMGESRVRLPKISLPYFKGNPIYWTAFWVAYESAIHNNSSLSNIDKFNYLRSLLEMSAYDAIAGLTLSAANYTEAKDILKRRFGNRQMIVSHHMDMLFSLNPVSGEYDNEGLRQLYNDV